MNKLFISAVAAAALLASTAPVALAATVTSDFTVSVQLAGQCQALNTGTQTVDFGTYTAFGAAKTASGVLTFNCTRGLAIPTFSFDAVNGSSAGYGVLAGLNYGLSATDTRTAGSAATAVAGGVGSATLHTVTISGTMAAGQAGECLAANSTAASCESAPTSHVRTLTVTY
jgi:spore coat protein U-like protein